MILVIYNSYVLVAGFAIFNQLIWFKQSVDMYLELKIFGATYFKALLDMFKTKLQR